MITFTTLTTEKHFTIFFWMTQASTWLAQIDLRSENFEQTKKQDQCTEHKWMKWQNILGDDNLFSNIRKLISEKYKRPLRKGSIFSSFLPFCFFLNLFNLEIEPIRCCRCRSIKLLFVVSIHNLTDFSWIAAISETVTPSGGSKSLSKISLVSLYQNNNKKLQYAFRHCTNLSYKPKIK